MSSYAIELAQNLVRCPSVTPAEGGALDLLQDELGKLGFTCVRLPFGEGALRVDNLFAQRGDAGPHFAFAGHTFGSRRPAFAFAIRSATTVS